MVGRHARLARTRRGPAPEEGRVDDPEAEGRRGADYDVKPITAKVIPQVLDDLEAENCRRLGAQEEPIVPVSLHYFLRDKKTVRALPDDVKARTEAYKLALPARCAMRPLPDPPPEPDAASKPEKKPS